MSRADSGSWKSSPPPECPFPQSRDVRSCTFSGRYASYTDADTWYPSWASDGRLYSPFTDTIGDGVHGVLARSGERESAVVGHAKIVGDDPLDLSVVEPATVAGPGGEYPGRYPSACLHHNGVWYVGTYGLVDAEYEGFNWPILGPFAGFHISRDDGASWTQSPHSVDTGSALFPEPDQFKGPVKLGAPHVVDFGQNMEHSPDGMMYLVAHGSEEADEVSRKANLSWVTGDQVYLCRVTPSPQSVNDESQYEYFAGHDSSGEPIWSHEFGTIRPIAEWPGHMGPATITWNAPLGRYLMCVTDGWPTTKDMDSYILESERITGPWKLVHYFEKLGPQAYFLNFPSKFVSPDGKSAWLCYSANFALTDIRMDPEAGLPPGSRYALCLQQIEFETGDS
jgi:hypothetical protein